MKEKNATPGKKKTDRTRDKLFAAAKRLFAQKGYDGVTVDEICQAAGLSKNVFYACFSSKHDLIVGQIREIDEEQMKIFEALPPEASCVERLLKFAEFQANYVRQCGMEIFRTLYHEELAPRAKRRYLTDETRPLYIKTRELAERGQACGELREDVDSREIASLLVTGLRGVTLDWIFSDGKGDLAQSSVRMVSQLIEGFRKKRESDE
ncbi:TetR/AcrR family transcriptional regulator [Papillibacter cinnamivorans]|uniref:Transcriptional regulator, TetR family n=1 Tax=Papillibacter cinnamivorans DSM 12816 TaxID=1122930 RepID=A0A1W1ZHN3_9FIRM|nr:TetR/AcrR family transcriptional regulator [Papillibacter cinnamivorans]SMC47999.1 transcriptional regulator, TetR family [Papillibacter cinnamivorans DSM 12816]